MIGRKKIEDWFSYFGPRLVVAAAVAGFITRIVLICNPVTVVDFSLWEWCRIFLLGLLNDIAFAGIALVPAFVVYTTLNKWKYGSPAGWIIWGILLAAMLYFLLFNDISDEYGGVVPGIVNGIMIAFFVLFSIRWFVPSVRDGSRRATVYITGFIYAFLIVANIFSEKTFWDEFGVRYNFIAVDYLVYTNEVVGNIFESYNMPLLIGGALLAGAVAYYLMTIDGDVRDSGVGTLKQWGVNLAIVAIFAVGGALWLHYGYRNFVDDKAFVTELQGNGCWNFLEAYNSNELSYDDFYAKIPDDVARSTQRQLCGQDANGVRNVVSDKAPQLKNIVLITMESLSAEFMERYGSTSNITPNLDTLARHSLVFDNLYAAGNRTVRGLEAVTLCIPPGAGESIVKRPECGGRFSTAEVLQSYGYKTRYLYGGDSYFDNMENFFSAYGYEVTDRKSYAPGEITFANIWGTCDEDSYKVALRLCDSDASSGKPFFTHIMTISNHRPYTYPEGKITYEGNPMSRRAAVKYTDFALGQFIAEASSRPWFKETVFVILADHCASSAGKTNIPVDRYHIPAMIYSPGFIEPMAVEMLCSQIDLMPTLFSLLGFSYQSRFYGRDILADDFRERAFMATYQNLGYYADGILTVLSPVRRIEQFAVEPDSRWTHSETLMETLDEQTLLEAQSCYQSAALNN